VRAGAPLNDELWLRHVMHPNQDRYVSAILALLAGPVYGLRARPHKDWGLKPKMRHDPARDPLLFCRMFHDVQTLLNLGPTELYLLSDRPGGLQSLPTAPIPAFVAGSDLLQGRSDRELAFLIARQLVHLRPDSLLRHGQIVGTVGGLAAVLLAGIKSVQPDFPVKVEGNPALEQMIAQFRRVFAAEPARAEHLAAVVQHYLATKAEPDLVRWLAAADLSATRAALLACGDVQLAARLIMAEPAVPGGLTPTQRTDDLLGYAASEDHFLLRAHTGMAIGAA
jgi:hypothetical protein